MSESKSQPLDTIEKICTAIEAKVNIEIEF